MKVRNVLLSVIVGLFGSITAQAMDCTPSALKAKALERLTVPGTKVSISDPIPVYEEYRDSQSRVIGYRLCFYIDGYGGGRIGDLFFAKFGDDFCTEASFVNSQPVTPIAIPLGSAK